MDRLKLNAPERLRIIKLDNLSVSEFISRQGAQMEILMRAKEANNPKFQFLNPDNPYHQIYKQVRPFMISFH